MFQALKIEEPEHRRQNLTKIEGNRCKCNETKPFWVPNIENNKTEVQMFILQNPREEMKMLKHYNKLARSKLTWRGRLFENSLESNSITKKEISN